MPPAHQHLLLLSPKIPGSAKDSDYPQYSNKPKNFCLSLPNIAVRTKTTVCTAKTCVHVSKQHTAQKTRSSTPHVQPSWCPHHKETLVVSQTHGKLGAALAAFLQNTVQLALDGAFCHLTERKKVGCVWDNLPLSKYRPHRSIVQLRAEGNECCGRRATNSTALVDCACPRVCRTQNAHKIVQAKLKQVQTLSTFYTTEMQQGKIRKEAIYLSVSTTVSLGTTPFTGWT